MKRIISIILALLVGFSASARADNDRKNDVGSKIQCACSCGQMLLKCNHVSCPTSGPMIRQLDAALNNYSNDDDILNLFRRTYGATVVVAPSTQGFELTIWIFPIVLFAAGLLLLFYITRRWRMRAVPMGTPPADPNLDGLRAQARRETEL